MAEAIVAWVGEAVLEFLGEAAFDAFVTAAIYAPYVAVAASVYTLREQQRRAKNAYNNGLTDRYVMQRTTTGQRQLVLGRARVSGPITFLQSYGDNRTTLAMVVTLAGHECDGIEDVYFNDTPLILDGSGNVVGTKNIEHFSISGTTASFTLGASATSGTVSAVATYDTGDVSLAVILGGDGKTLSVSGGTAGKVGSVVVTYQPSEVVYTPTRIEDSHQYHTATGTSGSFTVPSNCITSSAVAVDIAADYSQTALSISRAGNVITYTGATPGHTVHLMYQAGTTYSRARVRKYLGGAGQTADAGLISNLPGLWTSAHVGVGLTYLVVELDYDPSTFPNGLPNVSAVVRGLKCFDPRTSTTAWTDNPALLTRAYYLHPLGGNRSASEVNDAAIIAAANVCDATVTYTVGSHKRTTARYKASTVAARDRRPQDVLTDLCHAMGGRWVISGNQLVVKAGSYTSPVASINEAWLHTGSGVSIQPRPNRSDLVNAIVGSFADEEQSWQTVAFPKVAPSAYVTADGAELQARVDYPAVTYSGQAQYISSCQIRYNRAGLTLKMSCNLRAFPLEVFDVVNVSLARFGWVNKTFEVLATGFTVEGLIELTLKEIDSSIWALDAAYSATDYATKTLLPSPWHLPVPVMGTPASGTAYLLKQADGGIVSRIFVPITAITDRAVLQGGFIDVSFTRVGDPDQAWYTVTVPGDATGAFLPNVQDRSYYLIKARCRNRLAEGNWSGQIVHQVVGKSAPPANVTGLTASVIPGAVHVAWNLCTDPDYDYTILRYGASWAAGTTLPFNRPGNSYDWPWPAAGSYTIWAVNVDTTGNQSTPQSVTVTVDSSIYIGAGQQASGPSGALNANPACDDLSAWSIDSGIAASTTAAAGAVGTHYFTCNSGTNRLLFTAEAIPLNAAKTYNFNANLGAAPGNDRAMWLVVRMFKADGTELTGADTGWGGTYAGYTYGGVPTSDSVWRRYGSDFGANTSQPIPSTVAYCRIGVWFQYNPPGSSAVQQAAQDIRLIDVTDARAALAAATAINIGADGTLHGGSGGQVTLPGMGQTSYRVVAVGGSATTYPVAVGIYLNGGGSATYGATRSYNLMRIRRSDGAITFGPQTYDVYGNGAVTYGRNAATLAADLNATDGGSIVVLWTFDEPQTNRTASGLDTAMYRCGASRAVFGSANFKTRSAYILVGIGGCGEGNGVEAYQGSVDNDVNAWCDLTFTLTKGVITGISSTFTPKSLVDYGYVGSLSATQNQVFYQNTDPVSSPGGVVDGAIWISSTKAWQRVSGAWQPYVGNGSVDTSQLTGNAATDVTEFTYSSGWSFSNIA